LGLNEKKEIFLYISEHFVRSRTMLILDYIQLTIIPEFKLGLINAWIGTFTILLLPYVFRAVRGRRKFKNVASSEEYNKNEKRSVDYTMAVFYLIVLYSIVLPLKPGSDSFYLGAFIYLIALIGLLLAYGSFFSVEGGKLVTIGIYRVSRNPFYFFTILAFLGVGLASLSWLLILLTIIMSLMQHQVVLAEERICEANYGKEYLSYKETTARYFLFF